MHLAEPGCLCTKQALWTTQAKLLDGLGTRRRTGLSSQQVVWALKVPPGPLLFHKKRPWICTPENCQVPNHTAGWTGGRQRKKNKTENCQSGTWTQDLSQGHNHHTTQPPHTHPLLSPPLTWSESQDSESTATACGLGKVPIRPLTLQINLPPVTPGTI